MERRVFEQGERPCEVCGKPHVCYYLDDKPSGGVSWADPDDGHSYRPLSWEAMYRKAVAA